MKYTTVAAWWLLGTSDIYALSTEPRIVLKPETAPPDTPSILVARDGTQLENTVCWMCLNKD